MEKICLCGCGRTIPDDSNSSYYESRCRQRYSENQKRIISPDETVPRCACGCGELVKKDNAGKWNKYLVGHFKQSRESVLNMIAKRLPRVWTDEQKLVMGEKNHARWLEKSDVEKKLIVEKRRAKSRETKRLHREVLLSNPPLCACGCGLPVERKGMYWQKYIAGHSAEYRKKIAIEKRGIAPKCLCGCGLDVEWSKDNRRWNKYVGRHMMRDLKHLAKLQELLTMKPNGLERRFDEIKSDLFIKYVGDFSLWIALPDGRVKNPDFILEGTNKVIEIHGDRWHKGENEQELMDLYKQAGYDCLVIWEHEMKDIKSVGKRVSDFLSQ